MSTNSESTEFVFHLIQHVLPWSWKCELLRWEDIDVSLSLMFKPVKSYVHQLIMKVGGLLDLMTLVLWRPILTVAFSIFWITSSFSSYRSWSVLSLFLTTWRRRRETVAQSSGAMNPNAVQRLLLSLIYEEKVLLNWLHRATDYVSNICAFWKQVKQGGDSRI